MYENAQSKVRVGSKYSIEFNGVHQGSVLSPLFVCNCHGGYIYRESIVLVVLGSCCTLTI